MTYYVEKQTHGESYRKYCRHVTYFGEYVTFYPFLVFWRFGDFLTKKTTYTVQNITYFVEKETHG